MQPTQDHTETTEMTMPNYAYVGPLKNAISIAEYYGFTVLPPLKVTKEHREHAEKYACPEHHVAAIDTYLSNRNETNQKVHLFAHTRKVPYKDKLELRLDIIGNKDTSAEALLLQTAYAILTEHGHKDLAVNVNSVGGKESSDAFAREVASHFRKHLNSMEAHCREAFKQNVFAPLECTNPKCQVFKENAPQALAFLSEKSRAHFKEVLEYIESLGLPYNIHPHLVGSEHYTTRTLFTIQPREEVFAPMADTEDEEAEQVEPTILARGERYDQLSRRTGLRKVIPAINVTLDLNIPNKKETFKEVKATREVPKVYMVHIGIRARRRMLPLLDQLRQATIDTTTALHTQTLSDQLDRARRHQTPFVVIIGEKEVMDQTAIVRNMKNNTQDIVPAQKLTVYLKRKVRS